MTAVIEQAAGQAAGSLVGPAIDGGKSIFNCLKRKYGYVKNISKNFANLEKEERYLCDSEKDVKTKLERGKPEMQKTNRCRTWLNEVEKLKGEINDLRTEYNNVHRFFCGLCPLPSLMKLGKRILEKTVEVVSLNSQITPMDKMIEKAPAGPARVIKKLAKKIEEIPSLNKYVEMLQDCLRNVEMKRICIWGPLGVGKTTIMENLHNAVGESDQFDIVFWVKANTNGNVKVIQELLLNRLVLKADEHSSTDQRADMISEKLKNKRYVLFLDQVSSEINLREVGIHEQHKDGKVVFACRHRNICGETDEDIKVLGLSYEDAKKLFQETVNLDLKNYRHIEPLAELIVKECGGMPYIIKVIGKYLRKKEDLAIWRDTLSQLRSTSMEQKQELEEYYKCFKLVCDPLPSYKRSCLLLWAIFPAGYELHRDYIIECWRAEQGFAELSKLGEFRDKGHAILNEFVDCSLLEEGKEVARYKMFEIFQRIALRIANHDEKSCRILVKEGEKSREEEWELANRISLVRSCLSTLPKRPKCCRILTLLLRESSSGELPKSFFGYMCSLRLLDLHDTKIKLLPSSISSLINLTVLFLYNCKELMQLPAEVGDLCSLEVLDIRRTGIHALRTEIGQLTDLKCLRVSFVEQVGNHSQVEARPRDIIGSNIIARLLSLEELSIDLNPNDGRWNQTLKAIAVEVASLENLTSLCFHFPEVDCFQTFIETSKSWNGNNMPWGGNNFRSFSILVGDHQRRSDPCTEFDVSAEKHLRFSAGDGFPNAILKMLEEACAFDLIGHRTAANLSDCANKLGELEACSIEECNEMISIIDRNHTAGGGGGDVFQSLKKLHINNLPKLVHIWEGSIHPKSFLLLTTMTLKGCHSLHTLFSREIVSQLKKLQCLQVEDCKEVEEIIGDGNAVVEPKAFPKLKELQLCRLPRLSKICDGLSLEWPSLETTIIKTCEELKIFPSAFEKAAKLGVIRCTQDWWSQLDWPNDIVEARFQSYKQLI